MITRDPVYKKRREIEREMAERAVFSVLQKIADPLISEAFFLYGVSDDVEWLQRELRWIDCFLKDAEAKRRRGDELIKNWVREVREVAHQAEDIIDTFTLQTKKKKRGLLPCIQRYAAFPRKLISLHNFGTEIQGIKDKIDNIKLSRERYGLVNLTAASSAADETLQTRRRIYSHLDHSTLIVGLGVHKKEVVDRLLNPTIKRRCVVSIVGIGGLGKTTLANNVYNDSRIKEKFDVFACITVSQNYKVHEIIKVLVKQMMGKTMAELQSMDVDELGDMLRDFLIPRRYLIVLDDVWKKAVWDDLIRAALPEMNNGSRVLLTTRLLDVAKSIDPTPYGLPFLNEGDSWDLFLNKAFSLYQEESYSRCSEEMKEIGHSLVRRCGGLPLALEVLGGILSSKEPNSAAWKRVAEHFDWSSTDDGGDCSKILGLSYDNLPHHHLKSCFLYLGVFPEDSVIEAQELVELWIAEGFIPQLEPQLMEDKAHAYLEELANRSMIQVADKVLLGSSAASSVLTLRIHDLFRDLCIREAREDDLFNIYNTTTSNSSTTTDLQDTINNHGKNLRRLVVHGDIISTTTTSADCVKDLVLPRNLKSILQFGKESSSIIIPNGLKLLRVIHFVAMDNEYYKKFPKMFAKMRHLRYLRLSGRSITGSLPPCIRNLCNLQTLDLSGHIHDFLPLPDWLVEIRTLRHLYLNKIGLNVSCLADDGGRLDVEIDASSEGGLDGLEKLVNVQILKVRNLGGKEEEQLVLIDSLRKMKLLSFLHLISEMNIPIEIFSVLSENTHMRRMYLCGPISLSLHGFGFSPNLTTLSLGLSELAEDPMATLEKLPYLSKLLLWNKSYIGKEMVCTSGGFPRLQELFLLNLEELEEWRVEDGAMPSLIELGIFYCSNLKTLPEGMQHLRSLRTLYLNGYPEDRVRPEVGEDWYKVKHVQQIKLNQW